MAQAEQLTGSGEGAGEKGVEEAEVIKPASGAAAPSGQIIKPAQATEKLSLFDQLGGQPGISNIVADFIPRVMDDPRVNWDRKRVKHGGLSIHRGESEEWTPAPQKVELLKQHMAEFIALATGGPAHYTGREIQPVHAHMHISNAEFDAARGDLKVTLDRLKVPNLQQKDLLAIIESTRPEIVTER